MQHNRRRSIVEVADGAAKRQSMLRKLRRPARTNQKRNVAACLKQASAEIAADCPRSDNKNLHVTPTSTRDTADRPVPGAAGRILRHGRDQHEGGEYNEMDSALQHGRSAGA